MNWYPMNRSEPWMPGSRKELRRWLRRLHDELHVASVFVTHDQEEALEVSDRVAIMNAGRAIPSRGGTPVDVYDNPATPFVYEFPRRREPLFTAGSKRRKAESGLRPPLRTGNHAVFRRALQQPTSRLRYGSSPPRGHRFASNCNGTIRANLSTRKFLASAIGNWSCVSVTKSACAARNLRVFAMNAKGK